MNNDDDLEVKTMGSTCRILLDGKEILYSHQNILAAINSFLPSLLEILSTFSVI